MNLCIQKIFETQNKKINQLTNNEAIKQARSIANSEIIRKLKIQLAEQIINVLEIDMSLSNGRFFPIASKLLHEKLNNSPQAGDRARFGGLALSVRETRKDIVENFCLCMDIDNAILLSIKENPIGSISVINRSNNGNKNGTSNISVYVPLEFQEKHLGIIPFCDLLYDICIGTNSNKIKLVRTKTNQDKIEFEFSTQYQNAVYLLQLETQFRELEIITASLLEQEQKEKEILKYFSRQKRFTDKEFNNYLTNLKSNIKHESEYIFEIIEKIHKQLELI